MAVTMSVISFFALVIRAFFWTWIQYDQQHGGQNADDGDDGENFDEGET